MKRFLFLLMLCMGITSFAQTTWTGLGANTNWNNTDNWDTNLMPTASDDVIIPTGFTVTLNVTGSVKSITVQGNSIFEINSNLTFTDPSSFGTNTTVNWSGGVLNGTTSTMSNLGTINLIGNGSKSLNGDIIFNNSGTINITSTGNLNIVDGVLNNEISGIIDMQADNGDISWSGGSTHILNNLGLIKRTTTIGEARIVVELNNNDGIIQVESGTLSFQNAIGKNFTDGTYNVFTGANMDWDTTMTLSGNISGTVEGTLNWTSTVNVPTTATQNFVGNGDVNWVSGTLQGGGTLNHVSTLNLTGNAGKTITGDTTLNNTGTINITSAGDLYITQGVFNNQALGVIDIQADSGNITWSGGTVHVLNNLGLIKKTTSAGEAQIHVELNNNDGIIQVESGTLSFQNSEGKNLTDGTYNVFTGATMDWDTTMTLSGNNSGTIDGTLNWISNVEVLATATMNFMGSGNVNWVTGTLQGGGALSHASTLNLTGNGGKTITGDTTLNNTGTINIASAGDLYISQGIFNNQVSGVLDLQADSGNVTWAGGTVHVLNNTGLIKKTNSTGEAQIHVELNNNDGIIQVESGTLSFQNAIGKNLTDGTYNVSSGAVLDWDGLVRPLGTLIGTIDGDLNWNSIVEIPLASSATFNFSGSGNLNWVSNTLQGGGTLTNMSTMNLIGNGGKIINGDTTLNNFGIINITSSGDLYISQGVLNNEALGIIDLQADSGNISWSGGTSHILNNAGLIKRTTSTGIVYFDIELINSGTIEVASGELEITSSQSFLNETTGIVKGIGVFDLPPVAYFTNNGTFAPGMSPGTLSVQGDFTSTSTSVLDVELDGLAQGTEYDFLDITGNNVVFEGQVNVTLGFDANIGDSFTIATVSGIIATENLATPIYADFGCKQFTFDVTYPNNKDVLLTISAKEDILPPDVVTQDITVQLDASGNASITTGQIDNGSTDNCTIPANLIFALDITDFTCADLGANTVNLTVTDEAGNSANADAIVTVEDNIVPTVITQNITVQLNASGNASITTGDIDNGSSDNCTVSNLSLDVTDFTCADLGANIVNLTVTDQSGNNASTPATVTVEDSLNPTVITQDITVQLDATGNASITTGDVNDGSSDNCTINTMSIDVTDFTCSELGVNTVNLTVTDQSGNSASTPATVTVEDSLNPTVITQDITVQLDATGNASITTGDVDDGSSDNCTINTLSLDVTAFTCSELGVNTVNLTVTDQSGNSASTPATVTVEDNIAPTISCPADFTVQSNGDFILPDYVSNNTVTFSDNCGISSVVQTPAPGTILTDGYYDINFVVTDTSGNTKSCMFQLKVEDLTLTVNSFELTGSSILMYPNPATQNITLKNNSDVQLKSAVIMDVKGSVIQKINLEDMGVNKTISIDTYASGVYFIKINSESASIVKRLIKQ